jgi:hypothetical protein
MSLFPRRIEDALDVPIQRSHDAYPRKHRWPTMLRNEKQSFHRGLPFVGVVLCFRQCGDVVRGVA